MEALLVRVRTGREELPFVRALPCLASVSCLSHSTECARQAVQHQKREGSPKGALLCIGTVQAGVGSFEVLRSGETERAPMVSLEALSGPDGLGGLERPACCLL